MAQLSGHFVHTVLNKCCATCLLKPFPVVIQDQAGDVNSAIFDDVGGLMTALRQQLINELDLRGLSPLTKKHYVDAVYRLSRHFRRVLAAASVNPAPRSVRA